MRWFSNAVFLLIIALASACSTQANVDEPTPTPLPTAVRPTFTVQRGDIVVALHLGGRVAPTDSWPATFAVDGTIGAVYVQVGDYVEKSQLLADLESLQDLQDQWAKATAEANYEETVSTDTIKRAEIKLQIAQLTLQDLQSRHVPEAQTQIAELQVQLAQMDLDEVKANPVLHTAAVKVKELERQMADAQLKAPIAGYVVAAAQPGQTVRTTRPSFEIGDVNRLELAALALDEDLKQMAEGMPVTATLATSAGKPFAGAIRQLPYPYGSGNNAGETRITLNEFPAEGGYKLGDTMAIVVVVQHKRAVLWLPPEAIRAIGGRTFVVIPSGSDEQRVDVKLGVQTQERVEITAGLAEGQSVIGP